MSELTNLIQAKRGSAAAFDEGDLEIPPRRQVAVLTCIDARIDPAKALGLEIGDAHVLRNAGGRASDDVRRIRDLGVLPEGVTVSGHVHDVRTGTLREVEAPKVAA
jgi:carbonic anhydrase